MSLDKFDAGIQEEILLELVKHFPSVASRAKISEAVSRSDDVFSFNLFYLVGRDLASKAYPDGDDDQFFHITSHGIDHLRSKTGST